MLGLAAAKPPLTHGMAMNPRRLVLVSCRQCLQPIMLVGAVVDVEIASLADEVLRHFRLVGDHGDHG